MKLTLKTLLKTFSLNTRLKQTIAAVLTLSIIACAPIQRSTAPASDQPTIAARNTGNLVTLFLVKKDNLKNEFRGEVYPIALMLNDRYVEATTDVTEAVRNKASQDRILEIDSQRIIINAVKDFTVISNHQKLGDFQVEKPIVSQFSCSSMITGQGQFQGQASLQSAFEQIPPARSNRASGSVPQKFDETWKTTIAVSQSTALSQLPTASEADLARYRQDILPLGKAAIAQAAKANGTTVSGEAILESIQVVDLDRDGLPEVLGKVKQGEPGANASQRTRTGFAAVWITYKDGKPQLLGTPEASVGSDSNRSPYNLLETIDLNGDSIDEAIVERLGYESVSYEIYEYKNSRLARVFSGAGYGC